MKHTSPAILLLFFSVLGIICLPISRTHAAETETPLQKLQIKEHLNVSFKHELVYFKTPHLPDKNIQLQGQDGQAIPFQRTGNDRIALVTDLNPLETRTFSLVQSSTTTPKTDLAVGDSKHGNFVEFSNSHIAVRIPKTPESAKNGPIVGIKLPGSAWTGNGKLQTPEAPTEYNLEIRHRGPVFAEAICHYVFNEGKDWKVVIRIIAGEPAILISESSSLGPKSKARWSLSLRLGPERPINRSLYRVCVGSSSPRGSHHVERFPAAKGGKVNLTAWYTWWSGKASPAAAFFHLPKDVRYLHEDDGLKRTSSPEPKTPQKNEERLGDLSDDLGISDEPKKADGVPELQQNALIVAVGRPAKWARKGENGIGRASMPARIDAEGDLHLRMPINRIGREWLIGSGKLRDVIVPDAEVALPQKLYAKHLGTSLAMIQKMKLGWPTERPHPSLIFDRETYENYPSERAQEAKMLWGSRGVISRYYFNRDPAAREKGADEGREAAMGLARYPMSWFLPRKGHCRVVAENQAPHELGQALYKAAAGSDFMLGTDALTESQKGCLRARLAFLCYRASDPSVINHTKRLRNFPNMSIFTYIGVGMCAMTVADHPDVSQWTDYTVSRMKRDLHQLSGPNGGWAEAPHYQGAAMDGFMWFGLAARHAGLSDIVYDKRLRQAVRFLAKLSTPPDRRFDKRRHLPPIGNTYTFETSSQFGLMASIWQEKDPDFAESMQWMWQQQGQPENMGVGGDAGIHWHAHMLLDPEWHAEKSLDLSSEIFPKFGAVLRSHFPSERETYMPYRIGPWLHHYDRDMGSFQLWGKGRILSSDWGYAGHMPSWHHNRVLLGHSGRMIENSLSPAADYLHGKQSGSHRQILFIKSKKAKGPTWFLLRDWLEPETKSSSWWYWLYTEELPRLKDEVVVQKGTDDVDCDIWFANGRAGEFPRLTNKEWSTAKAINKGPTSADALDPGDDSMLDAEEDLVIEEEGPTSPNALSDRIEARKLSVKCAATGKRGAEVMTQYGLKLPISPQKPVIWALCPRFRKQPSPDFESIAEDAGLKVTHSEGIDYAFLAPERTTWQKGSVKFSGTAGVVQVRENTVTLTLAAKGKLEYADRKIESEGPAKSKEFSK